MELKQKTIHNVFMSFREAKKFKEKYHGIYSESGTNELKYVYLIEEMT